MYFAIQYKILGYMADIGKLCSVFFSFDLPCKDEYLKMAATVNLVMLKKK